MEATIGSTIVGDRARALKSRGHSARNGWPLEPTPPLMMDEVGLSHCCLSCWLARWLAGWLAISISEAIERRRRHLLLIPVHIHELLVVVFVATVFESEDRINKLVRLATEIYLQVCLLLFSSAQPEGRPGSTCLLAVDDRSYHFYISFAQRDNQIFSIANLYTSSLEYVIHFISAGAAECVVARPNSEVSCSVRI